jgi:UDP-3-O-[3-hydroxymyristoyl] glucosamine N-acyltransferase
MAYTLQQIAHLVNGCVTGEGTIIISGVGILRDAGPGDITLAEGASFAEQLRRSRASAAIVPVGFQPEGIAYIAVHDVHAAFAAVVRQFHPPRPKRHMGISPHAVIASSAKLGDAVEVHPGAWIGEDVQIGARTTIHSGARILAGCRIGEDVTIFPNVTLYEDTVIGPRCIIHANAVLGAYGFGYKTIEGRHRLSAQLGNVVVESDVEIGAATTIDRGAYGPTRIGEGTKIDNHVMIGHNCRIGRHNLLCSQVGIAGSTTTGDYVTMGGQVGVRDHVHIGERASLGAKAGVKGDIPAGERYFGVPATPEREQLAIQAAIAKLPELRRKVKELQKRVAEISGQPVAKEAA